MSVSFCFNVTFLARSTLTVVNKTALVRPVFESLLHIGVVLDEEVFNKTACKKALLFLKKRV